MGRGPRCPTWPSGIRRSVAGRKDCWRAHQNVVVVALANKLARIAWAVLRRGERFATEGMLDGVTFCCFSAACAEKRMIVWERWKARCDPPPRKWSDLKYGDLE